MSLPRAHPAIRASLATLLVLVTSTAALAQQDVRTTASQLRLLAANCANCHGTDGRSQGGMPALAGEAKSKILDALREFRSGQRPSTVMSQIVKGYTDAELDAVAGWFAARTNGG